MLLRKSDRHTFSTQHYFCEARPGGRLLGAVMPNSAEARLTKLETTAVSTQKDVHSLRETVATLAETIAQHHAEWRKSKEHEAEARAEEARRRAETVVASRMTLPQIITMMAAVVSMSAIFIGGGMYLVRSESAAVRLEIQAEAAKTALQVRGTQDTLTATQTGLQSLQRDMGGMAVKLGLVDAIAQRNAANLQELSSYDAHLARQEERTRALQDEVRQLAAKLGR